MPPADLADLPPLRAVIRAHGLAADRRLGQHFLLDLNLTAKIARAAGDLTAMSVYEVGPGPGGLTRALLAAGARRVIAVERDRRCLAALGELAAAADGRLELIEADALRLPVEAWLRPPVAVVANLPYNVSTALLQAWLPDLARIERLVLMFQREVADRLCAAPGSKAYGRLSVLLQWRAAARRLFDVPARAFTPPPGVTSSIVEIRPFQAPPHDAEPKHLEAVLEAAFGQRRKMLRRALAARFPDVDGLLTAADVDGRARAEELDVAAFCRLARAAAVARAQS